ncbi:MAG: M12 family metallopeptidase [Rhodospirillaceae bacterium]|nr:M12 family metallopeptidase [Rhodospirillaceae bacterium]
MPKSLAVGSFVILALLLFRLHATGGVPFGWAPPDGWIGGVIPYVVDERMSDDGQRNAREAMAVWAEATILKFVPRTDEPDFIHVLEHVEEDYVSGIAQPCARQPSCWYVDPFPPNAVHGLGHAIGLAHEQQRLDRDRYVRVFQENISPHKRGGVWNRRVHYRADISPYNYRSIMHYDFLSSKRNHRGGRPALETIPPHMPVGQHESITPGDADTVARMFGRTPTSWTISSNPLGLAVIVDGQEVTTPTVFDWSEGSRHTLSVPSPQARPGSRYRFGRWSDAGRTRTRTVTASSDITVYEANFVAAHRITTSVRPEGAGTVTISPASSDGYYPLRSEITMSAEALAGSGFRFLRWDIRSDYLWQFVVTHEMHGPSANPAHTYAMPGLVYTAVFTQGPILRVESNADPTTISINRRSYRTPISLEARSLPEHVTVAPERDFVEHDKGYRDRFRSWSDGGGETHPISVSRTEDTVLKLAVDVERRLETVASQDWHGNEVLASPRSQGGFHTDGTEVRLRASARPPAEFIGWNGDIAGRGPAAVTVMNAGKFAEAVFALDATELHPGVPADTSLHWDWSDSNIGRQYYVRVPPDASELEVEFSTRSATPGTEAGLFLETSQVWPNQVRHEDAHLILHGGVATLGIRRPPTRWPTAYFILVRAAESESGGTRVFEGTLVARVKGYGDGNRVLGGQRLRPGQFIQAREEACTLRYQTDGNLVAYKDRSAYWSSRTRGTPAGSAAMQSDGNFVVYDADGVARWSTRTAGNTGAFLSVQNDCNIVLRAAGGVALWSSGRP